MNFPWHQSYLCDGVSVTSKLSLWWPFHDIKVIFVRVFLWHQSRHCDDLSLTFNLSLKWHFCDITVVTGQDNLSLTSNLSVTLVIFLWSTPFCLTHWGQDKMAAIFTEDIFKCIFMNENVSIAIKISLKFVPKGPISNIPTLVQIMAWRRPGDKPLSEPMMVSLLTHICVTRPQWVNTPSRLTMEFTDIFWSWHFIWLS